MDAFVSLWSADLLDLRSAIAQVDDVVAGYHIDVFDGHYADDLLFGPDLVAALRTATTRVIEVHLNVDDPMRWSDRFADAGADIITVQTGTDIDVEALLDHIAERGCRPGLSLELHEPVGHALDLLPRTDRVLLLGTRTGIKGSEQDSGTTARVAELSSARRLTDRDFEIVVDGGIRRHTVPALARAGASGVVPGSLVFADPDPRLAAQRIAALPVGVAPCPPDPFWKDQS